MNRNRTNPAIDLDDLADKLSKVDIYEMSGASAETRSLLAQAELQLVEMALQLHPSFAPVFEIWEADVLLSSPFSTGSQVDATDKSQRHKLHIQMQCTLLAYSDGADAVDEYKDLIERDNTPAGMAIDCILCVLYGDSNTAIARYWSSAKLAQNGFGRQITGGLPGLFYALAVLKTKNPAAASEALAAFLQAFRASLPNDRFVAVVEILYQFAVARSGGASVNQMGWFNDDGQISCPWQVLFRCVCLHWLQQKPSARLVKHLQRYAQQALSSGVFWYSAQASSLLDDDVEDYDDYNWLLNFIGPASDWSARLQQIEHISVRYTERADDKSNNSERLVWWCHEYMQSLQVSPRVQKRSKKGIWTKGRKINVDELLYNYQNLDYLTHADRKFCASSQRDQFDHYRYSFRNAGLVIDRIEQFESLAELDNLYRSEERDSNFVVPMSIEIVEPHLEVLQQPADDAITIRLKPDCTSSQYDDPTVNNQWQMNWITQEKLQVTCFTPGQMEIAAVLSGNGVPVPLEAKDRVLDALKQMAPMITVFSDMGDAALPELTDVEADSTLHVELSPLSEGLRVELKVFPLGSDGPAVVPGHGGATILATIDDDPCKTTRDISLELHSVEKLTTIAPLVDLPQSGNDTSWDIEDPAQSLELLDALQAFGDEIIIEWPKGKTFATPRRIASSDMSVRVGGNQDWLQIDGELQVGEDRVLQMDALLRLMGSARGRFITLDDGSILALSQRLQSQLTALRGVTDQGKAHPLASAVIDDATTDMLVTGDNAWRERLERLRQAASLEPELPQALNAQLRDYQREGFEWMTRLAHWDAGACLADDMGLGKTIQALAVVLQRATLGPTLVVAPTSVCNNWVDEIARFAKTLNVLRLGEGDRDQMIKSCAAGDVLISSYGLLQNEIEALADVQWATVVADEAQAFKNSQTRRSKAMMLLKADFRLITTGTPIENHLGELWNLFRFINPGLLGSRERFNERFANPIEVHHEEQARLQLKALVRPFILRRLKRDVLTELPSRTEITQLVEFTPQETAFYEAIRRQSVERISAADMNSDQRFRVLAEITRLRQACCNPQLVMDNPPVESAKLRVFAAIVDELRKNGHRCLVFSQFVGHLTLIREYLDKNSISYQYLDGSTSVKKRKKAVDRFQDGDGELFLISLKAGGSGLNLTAADYVIHMDPWWNPAVEDQASDRAHRIGQTRPVTIYRLVVKGTIEEKIVALHANKRDLADGLLEGTDSGVRLSVDDLMQLLDSDSND